MTILDDARRELVQRELKERLERESARDREVFAAVRENLGLGPKAFAVELSRVLGPDERALTWHSVHAYERHLAAPERVMDAALELLRHPPELRTPVDLDRGMGRDDARRDRRRGPDRGRDLGRVRSR